RLLDLMTNSIYTNKEIFLRELVSNASDAIDKYHYLSLKDEKILSIEHEIRIETDEKARTITVSDNGIGMDHDEIVKNLGTIASSGSAEFLKDIKENDKDKELEIIGQFGVGFYSSFMVAKKVVVDTKSVHCDQAYRFTSNGVDSYTIEEINKEEVGTSITLYLKDNKDEDNYDQFLDAYTIEELIKKYSDYVRYPIKMKVTESVNKKDEEGKDIEGKYEDVIVDKTLNSMIPLWKKAKADVSEEMLNEFYKSKFMDYQDPLISLNVSTEGMITYNALLFVPSKPPYDLYSEKYEKGLQLYTKGVFIMEKCKDLLPDYLRFVRGLVDSSDLSLNISREMLQQNKQIEKIASSIEKKILAELNRLKENDYDKYVKFFDAYGLNLKWGVYDGYGINKDKLKDLLIYNTVNEEGKISLKKYVENMKEKQEFIYFASADNKEQVLAMPQMDLLKKQGYDVLILNENIDEFVMNILSEYDGKKFKSVNQGDLDLLSKDEKEKIEEVKKEKKPLIDKLKELLKDDVKDVVISSRLTSSPVCLVSSDGLSFEMEKVLAQNPINQGAKAERILEINPNHELFKAIESIYENNDTQSLQDYADLLLSQALLMEGFTLKDPVKFSNTMCKLMVKASK
ncbi:MAG: molecular chaperone HtpG, partial [Erysipelotrichaceae bacterium]|nr:molecular chaperone HtpG [Erysipelotrichaceae bacterium]